VNDYLVQSQEPEESEAMHGDGKVVREKDYAILYHMHAHQHTLYGRKALSYPVRDGPRKSQLTSSQYLIRHSS